MSGPSVERNALLLDRFKTVVAIVSIVVIGGLLVDGIQRRNLRQTLLAASPRYTVGIITRTAYVVSPSPHTESFFEYRVSDSIYSGSSSGKAADGNRFLVKFAAQKPTIRQFYDQVPIPDEIEAAPAEGWQEPPFAVPEYVYE